MWMGIDCRLQRLSQVTVCIKKQGCNQGIPVLVIAIDCSRTHAHLTCNRTQRNGLGSFFCHLPIGKVLDFRQGLLMKTFSSRLDHPLILLRIAAFSEHVATLPITVHVVVDAFFFVKMLPVDSQGSRRFHLYLE